MKCNWTAAKWTRAWGWRRMPFGDSCCYLDGSSSHAILEFPILFTFLYYFTGWRVSLYVDSASAIDCFCCLLLLLCLLPLPFSLRSIPNQKIFSLSTAFSQGLLERTAISTSSMIDCSLSRGHMRLHSQLESTTQHQSSPSLSLLLLENGLLYTGTLPIAMI